MRKRGDSMTAAAGDVATGLEGLMGGVMTFLIMSLVLRALAVTAAASRTRGGADRTGDTARLGWDGCWLRASNRCLQNVLVMKCTINTCEYFAFCAEVTEGAHLCMKNAAMQETQASASAMRRAGDTAGPPESAAALLMKSNAAGIVSY